MDKNLNKMKKLLKQIDQNQTYFNIHAGDVLGSFFLIVVMIMSYAFIAVKKNNIRLRKEWAIHKCKPGLSPFAGFINAPPGSTIAEQLDYTTNNYIACNEHILKTNINNFANPINNMQGIIRMLFNLAQQALRRIFILYEYLKEKFLQIIALIFSKIFGVLIEVQKMLFKAKDTLMKSGGVLQGMFLFLVGQMYFFMTFINSLFTICIIILVILFIVMMIMFKLGLAFIWAPPVAVPAVISGFAFLASYMLVATPFIILMIAMTYITNEIEKRDALVCFHPENKIKLENGTYKCMKDLSLGEKLINNIEVKAILRIKGEEKDKYYKIYSKELNDYIYVTGSHLIMHPKTKKFINVENYEGAVITNFWTNEMSCLVTSTNRIPIGEYTFWDWED
jgi:hypothetical protein